MGKVDFQYSFLTKEQIDSIHEMNRGELLELFFEAHSAFKEAEGLCFSSGKNLHSKYEKMYFISAKNLTTVGDFCLSVFSPDLKKEKRCDNKNF